jgi:ABC-type branched-subunit amino acid transport system permease subunit
LSLGQTAFFGVAGYTYAVVSINMGGAPEFSFVAFLVALIAAAVLALVLGYLIFFGRIEGVFVGIVTLSVTLILQTFLDQTAGPQWTIGRARLNGFNGMSSIPPLSIPWFGGEFIDLDGASLYWFILGLTVVLYLALRLLVNGYVGRVLVALRENPRRTMALGYDIRLFQVLAFAIGAVLSGVSGVLYAAWGGYITPSTMSLTAAAFPIVWVAAGGRKDIGASLLSCLVLVWLSQQLAVQGGQYALVVMGSILLLTILFAREGLVFGMTWLRADARSGQPAPCRSFG